MKTLLLSVALVALSPAWIVRAHTEVDDEADAFIEPIAFGLPESRVSVVETGDKRVIDSNDIPNHEPGQFPNAGNPSRIQPQQYHFEVPLHPVPAATVTDLTRMDFGVAVNGVKFDPGTNE